LGADFARVGPEGLQSDPQHEHHRARRQNRTRDIA
jgi:hypothetical protein